MVKSKKKPEEKPKIWAVLFGENGSDNIDIFIKEPDKSVQYGFAYTKPNDGEQIKELSDKDLIWDFNFCTPNFKFPVISGHKFEVLVGKTDQTYDYAKYEEDFCPLDIIKRFLDEYGVTEYSQINLIYAEGDYDWDFVASVYNNIFIEASLSWKK